jgi:predicted lactoylglutathione lyase
VDGVHNTPANLQIQPFIDTGNTMANKQIFVNLPVKNLEKTKAFFAALGYTFNAQFTDANAACMVIEKDSIFAMLLVEDFFKTFTTKSITDTSTSTEVLVCLSCESRAEVDALVAKAVAAGGTTPREPQDYGFMYGHGFQDIDGHLWELMYMDPNAVVTHQNA